MACVLRFNQVLAAHGTDLGTQASVGSCLHGDRMCPLGILASCRRAQRDMAPQRCVGGFVCCCLAVLISAYGFVSLLCCCCIRKHASLRCAVLWDGAVYLCQSCCCEVGHHGFLG